MVPLTFYACTKIAQKPNKLLPLRLDTLGDHVRTRRIERSLLQRDIAKIIGVSEDSVTYWENNRAQPQVRHYPAIIAFLGYYPFDHETESVAGKVRKARYTKGYSYRQFGDMLGVDGSTVRCWEHSTSAPSRRHLAEIKRCLG